MRKIKRSFRTFFSRKNLGYHLLVVSQVVALLLFSTLSFLLAPQDAKADIVSSRSITMETSVAGNADTVYDVSFTTGISGTIQLEWIVIDFCSNSPIIGDSCTAPTGLDTNEATITIENESGINTDFTVDASTDANTLVLTDASPAALANSTSVSFDLGTGGSNNGIDNPTATNTSFYARIFTYDDDTDAAGSAYTSTVPGDHTDEGGIALSTAAQIVVTAKVQETLTFCVYTGANCGAGGTAVALGDSNGVLSTSTTYTNSDATFDLGTNGSSGAQVVANAATLTSGSNTITAQGASCAADTTGSEQFGLRVTDNGSANTNVAAVAPYNCSSGNHAFDGTALGSTSNPWGDIIANTGGVATDTEDGAVEFAGNIAVTTQAGIYTSTFTFIGTATF